MRISGERLFGLTGVVSVLYGLSGCGGGGGGTTGTIAADTATGQFVDSAVQGLTYVSGSRSGVTDASGTFTYEIGQVVMFSIGGVALGQTIGQPILSPMHLIPGANVTAPQVGNITRFLMMLDDDGDPGNGIHISDATRHAAQNWSAVDFTMGSMSMHLAGIMDEVGRMHGRTAILPDLTDAQAHLRETLSCAYSGGFTGDYTGDSSGTWMMVIDAQSGAVTGIGHSRTGTFDFELSGHLDTEDFRSVAFEMASGGSAMFQGTMAPSDSLAGTWQDASLGGTGTFSGSRRSLDLPAGASGTVYHGTFTGPDAGMFRVAVDVAGNVVGVGYSGREGTQFAMQGLMSGNQLTMSSAATGAAFTATVAADGAFSGTWMHNSGLSGNFTGCEGT